MARATRKPAAPDEIVETNAVSAVVVPLVTDSARAIAKRMGYIGPLEPDALQAEISRQMRRTVEACLETGRLLILLKESCQHGDFKRRIHTLGVEYTLATRLMQAAIKFASLAAKPAFIEAIGNQTKLLELLVLDDAEVDQLDKEGSVGGITLDEIECMGMRELRKALREARKTNDANIALLEKRSKKIDEQQRALQRIKTEEPDETLQATLKDLARHTLTVQALINGSMRQGFELLTTHQAAHNIDTTAYLASAIAALRNDIDKIADEYLVPDIRPAMQPGMDDEEAAS